MGPIIEKDEKEEYKKIILDMLEEADTVIARHIGVSNQTIIRWKKELIAEGRTTEQAIQEARRQKKEEAERNDSLLAEVLKKLKEGKNKTKIATELKTHRHRIKECEDMLIEQGKITREEIEEKRARREAEDKEKSDDTQENQEIDEILKNKVLNYLELGIDSRRIANSLKISFSTRARISEILIKEGKITEEQIRRNREKRAEQDKELILELLHEGYTNAEIVPFVPVGNIQYVKRIVRNLKSEGLISDKEIEETQFKRKETSRRKIVLDGLEEGLTYQEIADTDETKKLTLKMVSDIK